MLGAGEFTSTGLAGSATATALSTEPAMSSPREHKVTLQASSTTKMNSQLVVVVFLPLCCDLASFLSSVELTAVFECSNDS